MPFGLTVSLVSFGHCDGAIVLVVLFLSTILVHLLLNRIESHLLPLIGDRPRNLPQSNVLQLSIGMCLGGIHFLLLTEFRRNSTMSDRVGNFLTDMLTPWMFGSFASRIPAVVLGSLLAAVTSMHCVTPVQPESAPAAKASLLVLSLFTIWVTSSDLSTTEQVAEFTAETFVRKLIGLPIDLGISAFWIVGLSWAFSVINHERTQHPTYRRFDPDVPPLRVKLVGLAQGWAILLGSFLIVLIGQ